MYSPRYQITQKTLRNIGVIEYGKAIVDNTVILPAWEQHLQKENRIKTVFALLQIEGINISEATIKKQLDGLTDEHSLEINNFNSTLDLITDISKTKDIGEIEFRYLHKALSNNLVPKTQQGIYRSVPTPNKPHPEGILGDITELFDWLSTLEGRETHPIVTAAIVKARIKEIFPFEYLTETTAELTTMLILKINGYTLKDYISVCNYFVRDINGYLSTNKNLEEPNSLTQWVEEYTEAFAMETSSLQEKIKLLAKDTKLAKATGRFKLTPRQERVIQYIQDYGMLQNKDFTRLFPDKSEDSILRDLKTLIDMGIVIKAGSTKSSRYELK